MEATKKAYSQIIKLLNKHKDICVFDIQDLESKAKCHLFGLELKELYGFNIEPKSIRSTSFNEFHGCLRLYKVGKDSNNSISWSDDGRQPKNEMLLNISFPTGAYIFGEDYEYQQELFGKFFNELKSYNPKYSDTANKTLYFSLDNAGVIFNSFPEILKKYHTLNRNDINNRKIYKLKKELEKLES